MKVEPLDLGVTSSRSSRSSKSALEERKEQETTERTSSRRSSKASRFREEIRQSRNATPLADTERKLEKTPRQEQGFNC